LENLTAVLFLSAIHMEFACPMESVVVRMNGLEMSVKFPFADLKDVQIMEFVEQEIRIIATVKKVTGKETIAKFLFAPPLVSKELVLPSLILHFVIVNMVGLGTHVKLRLLATFRHNAALELVVTPLVFVRTDMRDLSVK